MARPKGPELLAPLGFRLPLSLIERIDAFAESLQLPGQRVSRTDAIRILLERGLSAAGFPAAEPGKPGKRR